MGQRGSGFYLPAKSGGLTKDCRARAMLLKKMMEGGILHAPDGDKSVPALLSDGRIAQAQAPATKWFAEHQQTTR